MSGCGRWLPVAAVVLLALLLRLHGFSRGYEHDEVSIIEQLRHHSPAQALVDNDFVRHKLTDVMTAAYTNYGDPTEWAFRLPALLFGLLLTGGVMWLALLATDCRATALLAGLLSALDPAEIYYSQTMRGYIVQACFAVLLAAWLQHGKVRRQRPLLWGAGTVLLTVLLQTAVLTSPMIWAPLFAALALQTLLARDRPSRRELLAAAISLGLATAAAGALLLLWLPGIHDSMKFSTPLSGLGDFVRLPAAVIGPVAPAALLLAAAAGILLRPKAVTSVVALLVTVGTLGGTAVTGAVGPSRVYIYLVPFLLPPAAFALHQSIRWIAARSRSSAAGWGIVLLVLGLWSQLYWAPVKMQWVQLDVPANVPAMLANATDAYLAFHPVQGRTVGFYHPDVVVQHNFRAIYAAAPTKTFAVEDRGGRCGVYGYGLRDNSARYHAIDAAAIAEAILGTRAPFRRALLSGIDAAPAPESGILIAVLAIESEAFIAWEKTRFDNGAPNERWRLVNPWLTRAVPVSQGGAEPVKFIAAVFVTGYESAADLEQAEESLGHSAATYYWLP